MKSSLIVSIAAAACLFSTVGSAQVSLDAGFARAEGTSGAEFGAGYSVVSVGGFRITPGLGAFSANDDTKLFGRIEATYSIPAALTLGLGGRYRDGHFRTYGTLGVPLFAMVSLKANAGSKYYGLGLQARF
jgi:hypothetical protein